MNYGRKIQEAMAFEIPFQNFSKILDFFNSTPWKGNIIEQYTVVVSTLPILSGK